LSFMEVSLWRRFIQLFLIGGSFAWAAPYLGAERELIGEKDGKTVFVPEALPAGVLSVGSGALAEVAKDTLRYLQENPGDLYWGVGLGADLGWNSEQTTATLKAAAGWKENLDTAALSTCFQSYRWKPDAGKSKLRLTRYLVYQVEGRAAPEGDFQYALYAIPKDEAGLSVDQAEAKKAELLRYRYTRQQVAAGVYREGGEAAGQAEALVWLSHHDHEQAILQGTVSVSVPGQPAPLLFNVHRANGIPYDRSITDTTQQARYWYFKARDQVRGWGQEPYQGIALKAMAAVAGDLGNIGLGRVLVLKTGTGLRAVVLADTGGAFTPNLHQLDLFTGIFPNFSSFQAATGKEGDSADVWVLLKRLDASGC
jgi:membrane-bound lytic murein transglycosylase